MTHFVPADSELAPAAGGELIQVVFGSPQEATPHDGVASAKGPSSLHGSAMVIDDDLHVRSVICLALTLAGMQVRESGDGESAQAVLRQFRPDLVITDMLMPKRDGIEMIAGLRQVMPRVPIIAISGGGRYLDVGGVLRIAQLMGADRVLEKPFTIPELIALVREVLAR